MNRFLIKAIFLTSLSTSIAACAQSTTDKSVKMENSHHAPEEVAFEEANFETNSNLNLSAEQVKKIKEINQNIGAKFEAIGRNPSLSGYEKGEQKRALALQHKKDIYSVLTPQQRTEWESTHGNHRESIKDNITDTIDDKLEALEDKYKADKKSIEKNAHLSKEEKKLRKNQLETKYKQEKEILKEKKNNVRNAPLLQGQ